MKAIADKGKFDAAMKAAKRAIVNALGNNESLVIEVLDAIEEATGDEYDEKLIQAVFKAIALSLK